MSEVYIDLEILEREGKDFIFRISEEDLSALISFSPGLVIRNWDGQKPVIMEALIE